MLLWPANHDSLITHKLSVAHSCLCRTFLHALSQTDVQCVETPTRRALALELDDAILALNQLDPVRDDDDDSGDDDGYACGPSQSTTAAGTTTMSSFPAYSSYDGPHTDTESVASDTEYQNDAATAAHSSSQPSAPSSGGLGLFGGLRALFASGRKPSAPPQPPAPDYLPNSVSSSSTTGGGISTDAASTTKSSIDGCNNDKNDVFPENSTSTTVDAVPADDTPTDDKSDTDRASTVAAEDDAANATTPLYDADTDTDGLHAGDDEWTAVDINDPSARSRNNSRNSSGSLTPNATGTNTEAPDFLSSTPRTSGGAAFANGAAAPSSLPRTARTSLTGWFARKLRGGESDGKATTGESEVEAAAPDTLPEEILPGNDGQWEEWASGILTNLSSGSLENRLVGCTRLQANLKGTHAKEYRAMLCQFDDIVPTLVRLITLHFCFVLVKKCKHNAI